MERRRKKHDLKISIAPILPKLATVDTRQELTNDLKKSFPELTEYLDDRAIIANEIKVLFTDLDGTLTAFPGGDPNSAYSLVMPSDIFNKEKDIEINSDHYIFADKCNVLEDFFQGLIGNDILIVPVTQNYKSITDKIMKQITGTSCPGWYGSTLVGSLYTKSTFMTAVLFYIEDVLGCVPCLFFIDDSREEMNMADDNADLTDKLAKHHVRVWLGDNERLRDKIYAHFQL